MNKDSLRVISSLERAGISLEDALALRRCAMTLHRWFELECGDSNSYASWTIARGHKKNGAFEYDEDAKPFTEYHSHSENKPRYTPIPDREAGARKRIAAILAKYPELVAYVQGDPRGAPLHIIRKADIPEGSKADEIYSSRGIAVYK